MCLALATRYRPSSVALGALLAFAALNALAVAVGGLVAAWIPAGLVHALAATLFAALGLHTLLARDGGEDTPEREGGGRHPVLASAMLLSLAELGDKTQLAVAGLASVQSPTATWLGATAALALTSTVAAWAGAWLLPKLPRRWLHRVAGVLFLAVAVWLVVVLLENS